MSDAIKVESALNRLLIERNFSLQAAGALVGVILEEFPDDERFEDILDVLAQYTPGGGQFLFDEKRLEAECKLVMQLLKSGGE
jgi:hypothetical protein